MKKLIVVALFTLLIPLSAFATSGACSGHGGVSCASGSDSDGSVICNDGWRNSSVSYSSMVMCRSASTPSYSAPSYTTPTYTYPTYTTPITTPTYSARNTGIVAYTTYSCDYYIVQTTLGYSLLEWFGGRTPSKGDKIYGELNRFGFKDLVIGSSKVKTRAWIEDYMLTDKSVVEKFLKKCK